MQTIKIIIFHLLHGPKMSKLEISSKIQSANVNVSTNLLKFINQQNSAKRPEGKKCFPHHMFGVSCDAPAQFRTKNSLIVYRGDFNNPNTTSKKNPEFFSQKKFFSVGHSIKNNQETENNFVTQYNSAFHNNKSAFHTKSSKISQFFSKNAWMGDRFQVMGHQRSREALSFSQMKKENKIRTAKSVNSNFMKTASSYNFSKKSAQIPTRQSMREFLANQKNRINQYQNQLKRSKIQSFQEQFPRPHTTFNRSKSQLLRNQTNAKKQKQFRVNFLQWGHKDFAVNCLQWAPERNKQQKNFFEDIKKQNKQI